MIVDNAGDGRDENGEWTGTYLLRGTSIDVTKSTVNPLVFCSLCESLVCDTLFVPGVGTAPRLQSTVKSMAQRSKKPSPLRQVMNLCLIESVLVQLLLRRLLKCTAFP